MLFGLSNPELGVVMLVLFIVFIMLGFPIAFTLMALGVGFGYWAMGDTVFNLVVQRTYSVMANDVLVSIPLFIFMGYIIERANILDRLFHSIQLALGNVPGSLAIATLATCAIFASAGYPSISASHRTISRGSRRSTTCSCSSLWTLTHGSCPGTASMPSRF